MLDRRPKAIDRRLLLSALFSSCGRKKIKKAIDGFLSKTE
jgi:hypothetical protein